MQSEPIEIITNNGSDFFSYVFPVITLILGATIDRLFNWIFERKRITNSGEQWLGEINYFIKPIESQVQHIENFLVEHNKDEFKTPLFTLNASLNGDTFKSLSKPDLFKYIKRKIKTQKESIELASKLHATIEVATSNYSRIEIIFNEYLKNTSQENEIFNVNINKLMRAISAIGVDLEKRKIDPNTDPMFVEIFNLQEDNPIEGLFTTDLFLLWSNFIIPMIKMLSKYKTDDRTRELSDHLHFCSRAILKIKAEKEYLSIKMNKAKESLLYSKTRLNELLEKIEKPKVNNHKHLN